MSATLANRCKNFAVAIAIAAIMFSGHAIFAKPAFAQLGSSKIAATYDISFNGLHLGKFKMNSDISGRNYTMNSRAKITLFGGLFYEWKGNSQSTGRITRRGPRPASYSFNFKDNKKRGTVRIKFANNAVSKVERVPNKPRSPKVIPVTRKHLKGVFDPLSAVMLFTRRGKDPRSVCNNIIPVFDGKQRFSLRMSFKKISRISRSQSGAYSGSVIVCRVKYIPVAGHKRGQKETSFMAKTNGIEIWLMPMPASRLFVPYHIVLPTPLGSATATAVNFQIEQANGRQVALVRN